MAEDWFDAVSQPPAPERVDASREPEAPDNGGGATEEKKGRTPAWMTVAGALGLVIVGAGAVAYLVNDTNAAVETETLDTAPEVVDHNSVIGVAGECEPEDGEVEIAADDATVRGAVAQWQEAYYARDVETLEGAIAPDSWLLESDWASVLDEAAPEGTTWCAVMSPTTGESVDVDVMVTFPDGASETYPQTVYGVYDGEHWLIDDITSRED
ncbi:hypothetical protein [Corynebacterium sp. A21]|uniref:hypothetical protein n=1 Tax=Corynebacterium sp. A21 TaxID=3457318 RepID=UPI003FD389CA